MVSAMNPGNYDNFQPSWRQRAAPYRGSRIALQEAAHGFALSDVPPHSDIRQAAIKADYSPCRQSEICFQVLYMSHRKRLSGRAHHIQKNDDVSLKKKKKKKLGVDRLFLLWRRTQFSQQLKAEPALRLPKYCWWPRATQKQTRRQLSAA